MEAQEPEVELFSSAEEPVNPYANIDLMLFKEETKENFISIFNSVNPIIINFNF